MGKEIKIRDVSDLVVAKIDEEAKKVGKSRNEFLKTFLEMQKSTWKIQVLFDFSK